MLQIEKVDKFILKADNLSLKSAYKLTGTHNDIGEENLEELGIADTSENLKGKLPKEMRLDN